MTNLVQMAKFYLFLAFVLKGNWFVIFSENRMQRIAEHMFLLEMYLISGTTNYCRFGTGRAPAGSGSSSPDSQNFDATCHLVRLLFLKDVLLCPSFLINPLTTILFICPSLGLTAVSCPIFDTES
jgi:hypothetical protein